jgi:hypothetical protein
MPTGAMVARLPIDEAPDASDERTPFGWIVAVAVTAGPPADSLEDVPPGAIETVPGATPDVATTSDVATAEDETVASALIAAAPTPSDDRAPPGETVAAAATTDGPLDSPDADGPGASVADAVVVSADAPLRSSDAAPDAAIVGVPPPLTSDDSAS